MPHCHKCDRFFNTHNGYNQHIQNSAAHQSQYQSPQFECDACDRCFATEHSLHQHCSNAAGHPYCVSCKRMFMNQNNLNQVGTLSAPKPSYSADLQIQHLHSRVHVGASMQCPFCKEGFTTASGVTIHLESGRCTVSGLDRAKINDIVQRLDRNNIITRPLLTMPGYGDIEMIATERAWNGYNYECYLCPREFQTLRALNNHIKSPVHEQAIYRCPKASCGRQYKLLSGLIQHVESESCGVMRFNQVQQQAKSGIQNMVGRLIAG
jgi:hypothetical protein